MQGFVGWRAWLMDGWHLPTTRRRKCSVKRGSPSGRSSRSTGRIPKRFRTRSPRCGATSRTTQRKPIASSRSASFLRVRRPEEMLRVRLPIGPPELFAQKLTAFAKAGVQRVYIWPVADEVNQLERFWNDVRPLVDTD